MITNLRGRVGSRPCLRKPNVSHLFSRLMVRNDIGLCGKLRKSTFLFQNRYTTNPSGQSSWVGSGFTAPRSCPILRAGGGLTSGGTLDVALDSYSHTANGTQIIIDSHLRVVNIALGDSTLSFICPICISAPPAADTCVF